MNLLMLSITMIIILVLAIYAMTRGSAIEAEIQRLVKTKPIEQIYDEYRSNNATLNLYVAGGILLTGAFALIFFGAGGLDPRHWTFVNWIFAVIGLTATVAITLGQRNLYSSVKQNAAALLVTLLILTFVIFSEIATSSEREDSLVRDRSLQSPTLSAVLGKISAPDTLPTSRADYYYAEAARFESLARDCSGNCKRANQAKAEGYKAQARYEDSKTQAALLAQRENKKSLINESKNLEYVESNHTAVVRWLKEVSASTWTAAMMFASLIFVVAFESGFHFTGTRNGIYIEAISRLGYSVKRKVKRPTLFPQSVDPETRTTKPYTRDNMGQDNLHVKSGLGTHEEQLDIDIPHAPHAPHAHVDPKNMHVKQAHVGTAEALRMVENAASGSLVNCPECGTEFKKKNKQHRFCCPKHRDAWHNERNPKKQAFITARNGEVMA